MAQGMGRSGSGCSRVVGDYIVGRQIGSGSFSVVWHGRHRVHGTEVAIKEIAMGRLNKKLQESLMSEIFILKRINHPNIIRLHDIIEVPGKIHLVLEYCKGGDLSVYIQRHQRVPEGMAKHFMQQLAAGLQVLRDNNLIHRDLKPQNLLLSTNDESAVLKIADFGFARSLQPRGLAETLCGSPLYMAPEIMQLQKYDAKADLWSVGAILFQLVTGRTPFTGNNQIQLLQNIVKSNELRFPSESENLSSECKDLCQKLLRRNPVERLTFEEFFNHPFLSSEQLQQDESLRNRRSSMIVGSIPFSQPQSDPLRSKEESSQEDCLPFALDYDSSGTDGSPSFSAKKSLKKSTFGFSFDSKPYRADMSPSSNIANNSFNRGSATHRFEPSMIRLDNHRSSDQNLALPVISAGQLLVSTQSRVADSLENIDQDYVLVSGPPMEISSSSASAAKPTQSQYRSEGFPQESSIKATPSAPVPISNAAMRSKYCVGNSESQGSAMGYVQDSADMRDTFEQPSTDCMTRIKSLQECASVITELVNEKIQGEKNLEAFSIQLVILAIWKQALHICHTQAASATEGSPIQDIRYRRSNDSESLDVANSGGPAVIMSQIEREFLTEVEHAEQLAKAIEPGNTEMPDALETIFQSALDFGRHGGVQELMSNMESASTLYSKAVRLLVFLLVEAPSLILNPPFSLTNSDQYRLRTYIDILTNRQGYSRSQRISLLKCEDAQGPLTKF